MRTGIAILTACLSSTAWAGGVAPSKALSKEAGVTVENGLLVRPNRSKRQSAELRVPPDATGRIIVRTSRAADARVRADGRGVISLTGRSLDCLQQVIDDAGLEVKRYFNQSDDFLLDLEQRAAALSGYAQPRLPGMLYIEGAEDQLLPVMRALNDCPDVDWVRPETRLYMHGGVSTGACCVPSCEICVDDFTADACGVVGGSFLLNTTCAVGDPDLCPTSGACCDESDGTCTDATPAGDCAAVGLRYEPGATCADVNMGEEPCEARVGACCIEGTCDDAMGDGVGQVACLGAGGFWFEGGACEVEDCDPDCGSEFTGSCFDTIGNFTDFCDNADCCELVCDIDPRCCDAENPFNFWDELCAAQANLLCDVSVGANPCVTFLAGPCFEPAPEGLGGCNEPNCCTTVCGEDPTCCAVHWDINCATMAVNVCATETTSDTPDLTYAQGYLTAGPYPIKPNTLPVPQCNFVVEDCAFFFPEPDFGYNGRGFVLQVPGNPYGGLYGSGLELFELYGIDATGEGVLTKGKTTKVAVIEWGFWEGHEDLDVNIEPGQTLLEVAPLTPEFNHATACLGIIGGLDNGFGVTGIAPEAEMWFFPLTSVEEGPREPSAWAAAMSILGPGDVISCSYGPFPNLNCSAASWDLIRLASDLGIQVCLSAGNDCFDLGGAEDLGNSGALVVGACSPGLPWYRLSFSNFCLAPSNTQGNIVHVKAWGSNVATTGYGDLFAGDPDDPDPKRRFYTSGFNGTSAACPQIAGFVACLQGLAKQFYGIPMSTGALPAQNATTQVQFCMGAPGSPSPPSFCELNGGFDGPCGLDVNPDLGPNMIGPYPRGPGEVNTLLAQGGAGFPESPWLGTPLILRGDHLFGNSFSLADDDNSYLVIESEFTQAGSQPEAAAGGDDGLGDPVDSPISQIFYIATGQITDMVVTSQEEFINPRSGIAIELEAHTSGLFSMIFVELYDWGLGRWVFAGTEIMEGPPAAGGDIDPNTTLVTNFAARFFNPDTDEILVRCWTFGFGGSIGNVPGFNIGGPVVIRYDYLNFELTNGFGVVPGP
jgi:hypothetical protein